MELVWRKEGRAKAGGEGQLIDLDGTVEVGLRPPRSPGRADRGFQIAVGEEVEPLAIGAPDRVSAVVAVGGNGLDGAGVYVEELDLLEGVVGVFRVREPAAVGRPVEVAEVAVHGLGDSLVLFGFDVVDPELLILVVVGEPVAVGRGDAFPAQDCGVVRPLFRRGFAVGGELPELCFTGFGREGDDAFAVRQEAGFAIADIGLAGDFDDAPGFGGKQEDCAAGGEDGARAIRRDVDGGEVVDRLLDPVLAHLVEVGDQCDGNEFFVASGEVEEPEVGAGGVDDAALEERGGLDVEDVLVAFLPDAVALRVH